jgi:hypothetical protein
VAGGPFAEFIPCMTCVSDGVVTRAERVYEGAEDDHYLCPHGHRFGVDWSRRAPTAPEWPPTPELAAAIAAIADHAAPAPTAVASTDTATPEVTVPDDVAPAATAVASSDTAIPGPEVTVPDDAAPAATAVASSDTATPGPEVAASDHAAPSATTSADPPPQRLLRPDTTVRRFVPGSATSPADALLAWLATVGDARLRLPVVLVRGDVWFSLRGARIGGAADAPRIRLDDCALGVGLAERARQAFGDAPTAALWLEGRWRRDDDREFAVLKVGDPLTPAQLATAVAEIEARDGAA